MIDPKTVPFIAAMTHLKRFDECVEVLTSRKFHTGRFEDYSKPLIDGAFLFSDDMSHKLRRKELNKLTSRACLSRYDVEMEPIIASSLAQLRASADADGIARTDLMQFVRVILIRLAASFVGLDGMEDPARAPQLLDCIERLTQGVTVKWTTLDPVEVVAKAMEAKRELDALYVAPAIARRRQLVEQHMAGEIPASALPLDFITLTLKADAGYTWDDDLRLNDTIILLNGGLGTSAGAIAASLDEYWRWEGRDAALEGSLEYVRRVLNETLRLHPPVPFLPRQATEDVVLRSGRHVKAGEMVVVLPEFANCDPAVFGADAERFRPSRDEELPQGVHPYGIAFGGGPHLCFGLPLVTQAKQPSAHDPEFHRPMITLLQAIIKAGVRPDYGREIPMAASARPSILDFPVQMKVTLSA